jgi:hypothetical protein
LERPANAISGYFTGGYWSGLTALVINSADKIFMMFEFGRFGIYWIVAAQYLTLKNRK